MKTGIIVYVTGDDTSMDPVTHKRRIKDFMSADLVEIISMHHGHHDICDAWCDLTVKGMQRIICVIAEISGINSLRLTGRQLRLCG